jgi:hypothetical protein
MAGVSRANVSVVIRKMLKEDPEVVEKEEGDDGRVRFTFNYAVIDVEDTVDAIAPDIPDWLSPETYFNIVKRMNVADDREIKVEQLDWTQKFQRGGIKILVHEMGQKNPEYTKILRVDNCIVLT